eukprot:SAG31_NODE_8129_length_1493_cov_1.622442_2_plen_108_part_00
MVRGCWRTRSARQRGGEKTRWEAGLNSATYMAVAVAPPTPRCLQRLRSQRMSPIDGEHSEAMATSTGALLQELREDFREHVGTSFPLAQRFRRVGRRIFSRAPACEC